MALLSLKPRQMRLRDRSPVLQAGRLLGGGVQPQECKLWTCGGGGAGADRRVGEALPAPCHSHCLWGPDVSGVGSRAPSPAPGVSAQAQAPSPTSDKDPLCLLGAGVNSCDESNYNVSV